MPANLTPEYKTAEAAFRRASDPTDQLHWLKEMLRTIPKHKGTEHLRADIKTRIKDLTESLAGPRKGAARSGPPTMIRPEGAAQVSMLGPPNTGKSTLHDRLTGSHAAAGPYAFTTQYPQPGMLPVEDVFIQLIDLPPISPEHPVPWIFNAVQPADAALLVVDLSRAGCMEEVVVLRDLLDERRIRLSCEWDANPEDEELDPFGKVLPTLLIANKADLLSDLDDDVAVFRELTGCDFPVLAASSETGEGLERVGPWLRDRLGIVRVYTKVPGQPPDLTRPFTVRSGQTVRDVAALVHRDIAASLKFARVWGGGAFDGQQVGADHVVADGDVLELHF
jgi:hypothetical protein